MSLINQMLRDLDRRRGPAIPGQSAGAPGLRTVSEPQLIWWRHLHATVAGLAVIATAAMVYLAGVQNPVPEPAGQALATASHTRIVQLPIPPPQITQMRATRPGPISTDAEGPLAEIDDKTVTARGTQAMAAVEVQRLNIPTPGPLASVETAATTVVKPDPQQQTTRLFEQAQQALERQHNQSAETLLEQVLAADPGHTDARRQLIALMLAEQRPDTAEALLFEGLQITPRHVDMTRAYAQLLAQRNALQAALDTLEPVTAGDTADAEALALKAEILNRLQQFPEAVSNYRQAVRLQPDHAVWWTGLGVALEHDAQPAAALDAYRQAARRPLQDAVRTFVEQRMQVLSVPAVLRKG